MQEQARVNIKTGKMAHIGDFAFEGTIDERASLRKRLSGLNLGMFPEPKGGKYYVSRGIGKIRIRVPEPYFSRINLALIPKTARIIRRDDGEIELACLWGRYNIVK